MTLRGTLIAQWGPDIGPERNMCSEVISFVCFPLSLNSIICFSYFSKQCMLNANLKVIMCYLPKQDSLIVYSCSTKLHKDLSETHPSLVFIV